MNRYSSISDITMHFWKMCKYSTLYDKIKNHKCIVRKVFEEDYTSISDKKTNILHGPLVMYVCLRALFESSNVVIS